MKHCGTQLLETDRLILRRLVIEDAESMYYNWASDPEVTKFLTWPTHKNIDVTKALLNEWIPFYEKEDYYQWAITLKDDNLRLVGTISVVGQNDKISMAHVGYCIGQKWWNQNITSEALQAVIHFLFDKVGVNRIESRHDVANPHSGNVMKKCGMIYEGTMRSADWNNQGICDASYYAILKNEQ